MKTIEVGSMVTVTMLNKRYWYGAAYELNHLKYVGDSERYDKGFVRKYKVLRPLPDPTTFAAEVKGALFTMALQDALEQAVAEIEEIKDEMVDWRDNMEQSEGLSQTSKFDDVREAADALESIDMPNEAQDVPDFLQEQEDDDGKATRPAFSVVLPSHLATWFSWRARHKRTGRSARLNDAAAVFELCADALQEALPVNSVSIWTAEQQQAVRDMIGDLREVSSNLEGIDCPGMY
jgi:hypothetical protein